MPVFKDSSGREWLVTLTVGTLKRARAAGVDLPKAIGPKFNEFISDPVQVVAALWCACEPDKAGITEEQFAERLDGPAIQAATVALTEAVVDFSLPSGAAPTVKANLRRTLESQQAAITSMATTLSSDTATNLRAGSESAPTPTPSVN